MIAAVEGQNWPTPCMMEAEKAGFHAKGQMGQSLSAKAARGELGPVAPENPNTTGNHQESWPQWITPQAQEAGARVETLFTKDGKPATPGQRAYRKMPNGKMVLQSQSINLQVEMVNRQESWPTVSTRDHHAQGANHNPKAQSSSLATVVEKKSWATPQSRDFRSGDAERFTDPDRSKNLNDQIKTWATPATRDTQGPRGEAAQERKGNPMDTLPNQLMRNGGKLNPRWVETLMGLPIGWVMPSCLQPVTIAPTNCDCSATESSQPLPNSPSESCQKD
tara:strand:- start:5051 stop:5884 length:834 start_codon:yes stop_codon:yes gene_type:complete